MTDITTAPVDTAEMAPTGRLRAGVICAPEAGVFFVFAGKDSMPEGVTVDLLRTLGGKHCLPVDFTVFPNSGDCTEALSHGDIDVAFMPIDAVRRTKVNFGPAYYLLRSTLLIAKEAGSRTISDYQVRGTAFVGIAGTTTLRAAIRTFGSARASEVRDVAEAMDLFARGTVDAIALSEDYLKVMAQRFPGSVVMEDAFQETSISIAVPMKRPVALKLVSDFLEDAKSSGTIRQIFDQHGLQNENIAPAGV